MGRTWRGVAGVCLTLILPYVLSSVPTSCRADVIPLSPFQPYGAGSVCQLKVDENDLRPIVITGRSEADKVSGEADSDYSIYVDVAYADGTNLWGQNAPFDTGTHGWETRHLTLTPAKPVRSVSLYALFRNHDGSAQFDGFRASHLDTSRLFDGQDVAAPVLPAAKSNGWFVRDVAANSTIEPLSSGKSTLGVSIAGIQNDAATKTVILGLKNDSTSERAITVYYVERLNVDNPIWHDDIRTNRLVQVGEYANFTRFGAGATGEMSLYPIGCVTGDKSGRALGVPPTLGPRVDRIVYNASHHLLFVAFDLALTAKGSAGKHDDATVAVVRYDVDPSWGFRDAAQTYYRLFPGEFTSRTKAAGIWMPFTSPSTIAGLSDFHVAFHEGDNSVPDDRTHSILSFRYIEPMSYWMPMPSTMPRTYDAALECVQRLAETPGDPVAQHQAQALLSSGSESQDGRYNVSFRNTPWCNGAVWTLDPDPNVSAPSGQYTKAMLNAQGEPSAGETAPPDGEYLDSLEMMADVLDYRPSSLEACTLPLTFSTDGFHPVVPTWFSVYEDTASLSNSLHARNKLIMANSVPWRFSAFGPPLDVMGTETNMFDENGAWRPDSDDVMNLRRTVAYRKPYLLLLNTDFTKVDHAGMGHYFQRCLFYGIFPSMFSADASTAPYWQNPALYNRDRDLFKAYIPLIQKLSAAGWEPVTEAKSDDAFVWVERYGDHLFTVMNSSAKPIQTAVKIEARHLFGDAKRPVVTDAMSHQPMSATSDGAMVTVPITLAPSETRVVDVRRQGI